jgi:hypothetical protein
VVSRCRLLSAVGIKEAFLVTGIASPVAMSMQTWKIAKGTC